MKRLLWILVIALWIALLASSLFARIEGDDYCYANVVQSDGILDSVHFWYMNWSGLYTDQLISSVFAAVEPFGTRAGVPIMLGAFALAWWYALAYWYPKRDALLLALAFGAALAVSRPNDEPIYWLSGVTSYWLPIAGVGALLGALARRKTLLAILISFLTVSLSETGGVLILTGFGLAFLLWKGERRRLFVVGAAATFGFLIMYFAPGNAVRRSALEPVELNLYYLAHVLPGGFATNTLLSALWAIVPGLFVSGVGALMGAPFPALKRLPLVFLSLALGGSALIALLAAFTTSWGVGERVIFLLVPFWLAQWFFIGALIGRRVQHWRWMTLVGLILLIPAVQHVIARAEYARLWDARHTQVLAGEAVPQDIGSWDSFADAAWVVTCASNWYGRDIQFVDENRP